LLSGLALTLRCRTFCMYSDSDSAAAGGAAFTGADGCEVRDWRIAHPENSETASATDAPR
jgi:hypothetical protein